MIDVPVSLIGTLGVMAALGFSLNNLSLFGLVLAIGIVVDDAIVVVENIERWMAKGLEPPRLPSGPWLRSPARSLPSPGPQLGLHPDGLPHGHQRPVLSPVRPYHRCFHHHLSHECADDGPGPGRATHQAS